MTHQEKARQIYDIMQQDYTDGILDQHADDYLVLHRSEIDRMSPSWKNVLCDLLEELEEKEYNFVVMVRNDLGQFVSDPFGNRQ